MKKVNRIFISISIGIVTLLVASWFIKIPNTNCSLPQGAVAVDCTEKVNSLISPITWLIILFNIGFTYFILGIINKKKFNTKK